MGKLQMFLESECDGSREGCITKAIWSVLEQQQREQPGMSYAVEYYKDAEGGNHFALAIPKGQQPPEFEGAEHEPVAYLANKEQFAK